MKLPAFRSPGSRVLSFLFLIHVFVIALFLVWAAQLLKMVVRDDPVNFPLLLGLSFIFPLFLLIATLLSLLRVWKQRRSGQPGSRLRLRLVLSFALLVFITAIPQGLLAGLFLRTAMAEWLAPHMQEALEGGQRTVLTAYQGALNRLESFAESRALDTLLSQKLDDPPSLWIDLKDIHSELEGLQVISSERNVHFGDPRTLLSMQEEELFLNEGPLPRRSVESSTVLFWQIIRGNHRLILAAILPEGFDKDSLAISSALDTWQQYKRLQNLAGSSLLLFWLFISGPLMLLAFLMGMTLSDRMVRPLVQLGEATHKIAEGDFSFRILGHGDEELSFLTASFNQMIEELEVSRTKILQTEKVAAWQGIAQRLAHELRNPLTPIKLSTQHLMRKIKKGPIEEEWAIKTLELILREVDGLDSLLQDFRDFAGGGTLRKEPVLIRELLLEALNRFRSIEKEIKWNFIGEDDNPTLQIDPRQIRQVLVNLLKNAAEAGATEITLRLDIIRKGVLPYVRFQVRDNGEGIPAHRIDKIFQPYETSKSIGSGLGLAVAQRIIYDHRGRVWFESELGKGTVFFIDLPIDLPVEGTHEPYLNH